MFTRSSSTLIRSCLLICLMMATAFPGSTQGLHEGIDTARHSLDVGAANRSMVNVQEFVKGLLTNVPVDTLLKACTVPFVVDRAEFATTEELKKLLVELQAKLQSDKTKPRVDYVQVVGRRHEILNGLLAIDVYFVLCTLRFDIDGQTPTKQVVFAVQKFDVLKIVGISAE